MKKPILFAVASLSLIAFSAETSAHFLANDDFESYSNDAELTGIWSRVSGTSSTIFLSTDPEDGSNNTIEQTTAAGRLRYVVPTPTVGTAQNPLVFSFDLYDASGNSTTDRVYGELRQSDGVGGLIAAGMYTSADTGAWTSSQYQARNLDNGAWIQLDAPRSVGWHNFKFVIEGNSVDLYVDGVLDPQFTDRQLNGSYDYDWVHLGSALASIGGTGTGAHFDNVQLVPIPEPSTYAMIFGVLALGGAIIHRRRIAKA